MTGPDLPYRGLGVDAALATRLPLEVLDGVGDVDLLPGDARLGQRFVEHLSRRSHERLARQVLLVSRLLADEERRRLSGADAQDRLRGVLVEVAGAAALGGLPELRDRGPLGDELEGGWMGRGFRHLCPPSE